MSSDHPAAAAAGFPLTRANIRERLPQILGAAFNQRLPDMGAWRAQMAALYARDAVFDYPLAKARWAGAKLNMRRVYLRSAHLVQMEGRADIIAFWTMFLLLRALQLLDVHTLTTRVVFDEQKLQAYVELHANQTWDWFAWLDRIAIALRLISPGQRLTLWKVWSAQLVQFEEVDGELRITHQIELVDQFIWWWTFPLSVILLRAQRGTLLGEALEAWRRANGRLTGLTVRGLEAAWAAPPVARAAGLAQAALDRAAGALGLELGL